MKTFLGAAVVAALLTPLAASAAPLCDDLGFAGVLASCNRGEPIVLTLASGQPLHPEGAVELQSGAYYELEVTADGSAELAVSGPEFFRAVWFNEIVINQIEVRPMAIDSLEFDAGGTATISFVAIKPGTFELKIPGTSGESQKVTISIR
jgi:hypothetical protein